MQALNCVFFFGLGGVDKNKVNLCTKDEILTDNDKQQEELRENSVGKGCHK